MMRGLFYWAGGLLFTALFGIFFYLAFPVSCLCPGLPHRIVKLWSKGLLSLFCGVRVETTGGSRVPRSEGCVIVSNHRSHMDILVASAAIPLPFLWLAKSSLFRIPVFGLAMRLLGHIPVEREKFMSASRSLEGAESALRRGSSVWVFPEGTRTPLDALGKFKRGAFLLAARSGKPILPVALRGTDGIFESPLRVRPGVVRVSVLEPFTVASVAPASRRGEHGSSEPGGPDDTILRAAERAREMIQAEYYRENDGDTGRAHAS